MEREDKTENRVSLKSGTHDGVKVKRLKFTFMHVYFIENSCVVLWLLKIQEVVALPSCQSF